MPEQAGDRSSVRRTVAQVIAAVVFAIALVTLIALAVAWLSPARESVLRPWWR
jgi:hypothetical protein